MDILTFTRTDGATPPTVLLEMKADGLWSDGKTPDATLEITKDTTACPNCGKTFADNMLHLCLAGTHRNMGSPATKLEIRGLDDGRGVGYGYTNPPSGTLCFHTDSGDIVYTPGDTTDTDSAEDKANVIIANLARAIIQMVTRSF